MSLIHIEEADLLIIPVYLPGFLCSKLSTVGFLTKTDISYLQMKLSKKARRGLPAS